MKKLVFGEDKYEDIAGILVFAKTEDRSIGLLELAWQGVVFSPLQDLKLKDHKVNKRLKKTLKEFTRFRDGDKDSRIAVEGFVTVIMEEAELELLKRHLNAHNFNSKFSEDVVALYDVLDNAQDFDPNEERKLQLLTDKPEK